MTGTQAAGTRQGQPGHVPPQQRLPIQPEDQDTTLGASGPQRTAGLGRFELPRHG
ncbi:hypothetical protein DAR3_1827 [plant metagenome]